LIKSLQVVPESRRYSRRAATVGLSIFLAVGVSSLGTWLATRWQTNDQTLVTLSGASAKVVGTWGWFNPVGSEVKITADGKIIHLVNGAQIDVGNWIPLNSEGLIQINWITGWSDQWQLSADGNSMSGKNQNGSMGPVHRKQLTTDLAHKPRDRRCQLPLLGCLLGFTVVLTIWSRHIAFQLVA
jgi:hypothetical protein